MQLVDVMKKLAQTISLAMVISWLAGLVFFYGMGPYFMAGMLLWLILVSLSLMAWKTDIFGGALFLVAATVLLLIIIFNELSVVYYWLLIPLATTGGLYVAHYLLQESQEAAEVDDF